eukprot:scaffold1110_cov182-Ochromonas_danica.AAC.26
MNKSVLLILCGVLLLIYHTAVEGACPNFCSGHGDCGANNICSCYTGWNGGSPDCSYRSCPNGTAWVDKAYATDAAHQLAECSNAGLCDRSTGQCQCFTGFTGSACQRMLCPNRCSGHGICSTIADATYYQGIDYDSTLTASTFGYGGDGYGVAYTNWDKNSIQLCECDEGFFGPDCSQVMCPRDDDPLTINQNYRSIKVKVHSYYLLAGTMGLEFQGTTIFLPMINYTNGNCSEEISYRGKYGKVGCESTYIDTFRREFVLTFYSWPLYPKDTNLYSHNGNPSKYEFRCNVAYLTKDSTCLVIDLVVENIREYAYCSNRGICDFTTGLCSCVAGYTGPACSNTSYVYTGGTASQPGLVVNSNALDFNSTNLVVRTMKSQASDFYMINGVIGNGSIFSIRGDGLVNTTSLRTTRGGMTIAGGGWYIDAGGLTVMNGGVDVTASTTSSPVMRLSSTRVGALSSTSYSALSILANSSYTHNNFLVRLTNRGRIKTRIRADGAFYIRSGGLYVSQGITVASQGLYVTGGGTINTGGAFISLGGLSVTGGLSVMTSHLVLRSGGLNLYGGLSIGGAGLKVVGGVIARNGYVQVTTGGMTVNTQGLKVNPSAVSIQSGGVRATGGVTINTGGLSVRKQLQVKQGGINLLQGGMTIRDSLVYVTGGVTVASKGLLSDAAFVSGGMMVTTAGVKANIPVHVTGGMTVNDGFLIFYLATATIASGGIYVNNADAIFNTINMGGGLRVTGGVTVNTFGFWVTGGLTISSMTMANLVATDVTMDVAPIATEMRVFGTTELQSSPVIFSDRRLKTNLTPITGALDKVSKLKGLYFNWAEEGVSGMRMDRRRHA